MTKVNNEFTHRYTLSVNKFLIVIIIMPDCNYGIFTGHEVYFYNSYKEEGISCTQTPRVEHIHLPRTIGGLAAINVLLYHIDTSVVLDNTKIHTKPNPELG